LLVAKKLKEDGEEIIQFGMEDVKATFEKLIDNIKMYSLKSYTQVNGKMISQLIDNQINESDAEAIKKSINEINTINIILSRVGNYISEAEKRKIRDLISSGEILKKKTFFPLASLLHNLVKAYNKEQKKIDESIEQFVNICNSYLVDKYFEYDESFVSIHLFNKKDEIVDLSNLSSGEKQIISIFSKIYLSNEEHFFIFFDEPELSLSIKWQEKLLVDILKSGKCDLLFAVTHSPFIFNNDLKEFARSIDLFVEEQ